MFVMDHYDKVNELALPMNQGVVYANISWVFYYLIWLMSTSYTFAHQLHDYLKRIVFIIENRLYANGFICQLLYRV